MVQESVELLEVLCSLLDLSYQPSLRQSPILLSHSEQFQVHAREYFFNSWGGGGGGAGGPNPPPLKNHKNIEFLINTSPDHLKNHKATKPAFNVGPSSARQ